MQLEMTEEKIRKSYLESRNKKLQLTILSELNNCPVYVIRQIVDKSYKPEPIKQRDIKLDDTELIALYNQGLSDQLIADRVGVGCHRIRLWRNRKKLAPNYRTYCKRRVKHDLTKDVSKNGRTVQWVTSADRCLQTMA